MHIPNRDMVRQDHDRGIGCVFKHTQMQVTFGIIMLALVDNRPEVMNLKQLMSHFLDHRENVVVKRSQFDLRKAEERAHILEGLLKALDHIDEKKDRIKEDVRYIVRLTNSAGKAKGVA